MTDEQTTPEEQAEPQVESATFTVEDALQTQEIVNQLVAQLAGAKDSGDEEKIQQMFGDVAAIIAGGGAHIIPMFLTVLDTAAFLVLELEKHGGLGAVGTDD